MAFFEEGVLGRGVGQFWGMGLPGWVYGYG